MAKQSTWEGEVSNLIKSLTGSRDSVASPEASIVGGGAAGTFRAQQMANAKAANLARASGAAAPASSALTNTGTASGGGGGLTTTGGNIATQGAQPNTALSQPNSSLIKSGNAPFPDASTMRNATPRSGAGIGSVLSGGAVLNPVAATAAALLASTGEAGRGDYVVNEGDINDIIYNPTKYGMVPRSNVNSAPAVSRSAPEQRSPMEQQMVAPATPAVSRSAPEQRSPMEQQMVAPKAVPVAEPVDTNRAAALFAKTHGSAFDPKSSMDKKKMAAITSLMAEEGSESLTPNQFALKIYRATKK